MPPSGRHSGLESLEALGSSLFGKGAWNPEPHRRIQVEFSVPAGLPAPGVRPRLRFVIGNTIFPNANRVELDDLVVRVRVPPELATASAWQLNNLRQFHVVLELPEGLLTPGSHRLEISPEALPGLSQVWPTSIDGIELELEPGRGE